MAYVSRNDEQELLTAAAKHAPFVYRWLGWSLSVSDLDNRLGRWSEWLRIRKALEAGDKIWPFAFNKNTSAMRVGFVFVRNRQPFDCIVVVSS